MMERLEKREDLRRRIAASGQELERARGVAEDARRRAERLADEVALLREQFDRTGPDEEPGWPPESPGPAAAAAAPRPQGDDAAAEPSADRDWPGDRDLRLHLALVLAGAGLWDWDVERGTLSWSPECHDLYGLPPGRVEPSPEGWLAVMLPDDRPAARAALERARQPDAGDFQVEFRIHHPVKGVRWFSGRGRVLARDGDGRPRRLAGLVIDVTAARRMQDDVDRARGAAEQASHARTRFLASVSHDLRQPIQAAALYGEVLRRQMARGQGREAVLETAGLLQSSIGTLHAMLDGLLDLARLEAGVIEPSVIDFDPDPLLFRLASEALADAEASGVELRFRPCGLPISTDPRLLDRILRHLVANAIKHGAGQRTGQRTGGRTGGVVLVIGRRRDGHALFQVWDNGPGIPPEHLDSIFEEFRQLGNPERNAAKGFGLGLSIVAGMAGLLGLRVGVRSVVGRGSVFTVAVPLARSAVATLPVTAAAEAAVPDLGGRLALVVEDDDAVRTGLRLTLEGWGAVVVTARSPDDLAPKLDGLAAEPDLLIADYRLPGGATGRAVVEMVRRRWAVPAVIITGDTDPERLREARSIGCRLMHKPVQPRELAETLAEVMQDRPARGVASGHG